jgi:SAM-dependent methyltransferase
VDGPADVKERAFWDEVLARETLAWGDEPSPVVEWLASHLPAPARVFVPGCGYGRNVLGLARRGYELVAADSARTGLARARTSFAHPAIEYVEADLFERPGGPLGPSSASFDGVLAHYVIHLFGAAARARLLSTWGSALRPGGLLVVTALSTRCSFFGQGREIEPGMWSNPGWIPIHFETPDTLALQLREHGFIDVRTEEGDEPENKPTGRVTTPTIYALGRRSRGG